MTNFYTNSFEFMTYDANNYKHQLALLNLEHDNLIQKYLPSVSEYLEFTELDYPLEQAYLVGNDLGIVGYLAMFNYGKIEEIHYATIKEYRGVRNNLGETIGTQIVKEASKNIFDNYQQIQIIRLIIKLDNIRSIKTAEACGFKKIGETPVSVEYQKSRTK